MKILAIDPSGAFNEGKGETGYVITINNKIISFGSIKAWEYVSRVRLLESNSRLNYKQ